MRDDLHLRPTQRADAQGRRDEVDLGNAFQVLGQSGSAGMATTPGFPRGLLVPLGIVGMNHGNERAVHDAHRSELEQELSLDARKRFRPRPLAP